MTRREATRQRLRRLASTNVPSRLVLYALVFGALLWLTPYRGIADYVFLVAMPLAALLAWAGHTPRPRYGPGLCPKCGYDLRATPDKCPECGQVPSSA